MRVLWFSPTPSRSTSEVWIHNGGGWISSLEHLLENEPSIKLGVAFEYTGGLKKGIGAIDYYPIDVKETLRDKFDKRALVERKLCEALKVIEDFNPDIIQMFGSESWYGLLAGRAKTPIVIHMQGCLPPYYNARYPVGISTWDKIFSAKTTWKEKIMAFRIDASFKRKALMEETILRLNSNFMGRTHWDKAIISLYNPTARYFHCEEALRENFVHSEQKWKFRTTGKIQLLSTISGPLYKGLDVILKTAKLLKENTTLDFEWDVCGINKNSFIEHCYKIDASDVGVKYLGVVSAQTLVDKLSCCSLFIHPSYIDNSPNNICEAQILGVPVISTNVGGISSLIQDGGSGFLVPANDPFILAHLIIDTVGDQQLMETISRNAISVAVQRHNPEQIKNTLVEIYKTILTGDNH